MVEPLKSGLFVLKKREIRYINLILRLIEWVSKNINFKTLFYRIPD